jgi:hypothetical protein
MTNQMNYLFLLVSKIQIIISSHWLLDDKSEYLFLLTIITPKKTNIWHNNYICKSVNGNTAKEKISVIKGSLLPKVNISYLHKVAVELHPTPMGG